MVNRAIHRALHDAGSWLLGSSGKRDRKAGERTWQLMTEQIGNSIALLCILFFQEDEEVQTPIMVHRHLGIKTERLAARTKQGRCILQIGKGISKKGAHCLLI